MIVQIVMAVILLIFGIGLVLMSFNSALLQDLARSRERIGLPPGLRGMKWSALLGGFFFVAMSLAQLVDMLAD